MLNPLSLFVFRAILLLLSQLQEGVQSYPGDGGQNAQQLVGAQRILEEKKPSNKSHTELAVANHIVAEVRHDSQGKKSYILET